MTNIHQIYCTHCTYGSSALERREGELASRVLGYSARSGSLEPVELRKYYRHVERFLYYYLPADAPPEEKLRLDAAQAPRRLVYYPSINGLQMLGQVSYRQQDTVGRPGSYFGHVIFSQRDAGAWNVLDCLQLWGAPWADEDSPALPFVLPALDDLGEMHRDSPPIINDALLLSFLKTPRGAAFDDPHGVIPERWKDISEESRAALLIDVLHAYLNLPANRRESVLLVIEPSLAALVFYGVARLLPKGPLSDEISFSTFEPSADRLPVALAATTFLFPETTDLKPEMYRGRGYVNNTFLNKCSERPRGPGTYARIVVEKLLSTGCAGVDRMLAGFAAAGAASAKDLEELAQVLELVPTLLDPAAPMPQLQWSAVAANYLGYAMRERLAAEPANSPLLAALVGTPRHLTTLKLIATDAKTQEAAEAVRFLMRKLPEKGFQELVASERISRALKVDALVGFVQSQGRFPEPCEPLWSETVARRTADGEAPLSLLSKVLTRLPDTSLEDLAERVPKPGADRFLLALIEVCRRGTARPSAEKLATRLLGELDDDELCSFLIHNAAECPSSTFPKQIGAVRARLDDLLRGLPTSGRQFDSRLDLLKAWEEQFPNAGEAEQRLEKWRALRAALLKLREPATSKQPKGRGKHVNEAPAVDYDAVGETLAKALKSVMRDDEYPDDVTGEERVTCLRRLGATLLGRGDFLPPQVWSKIQRYFEEGTWSKGKLRPTPLSSAKGSQARKKSNNWSGTLFAAAVPVVMGLVFLMVVGIYLAISSTGGGDGDQTKPTVTTPSTGKPIAKPAGDQVARIEPTKTANKDPASAGDKPKDDAPSKPDAVRAPTRQENEKPPEDNKSDTPPTDNGAPSTLPTADSKKTADANGKSKKNNTGSRSSSTPRDKQPADKPADKPSESVAEQSDIYVAIASKDSSALPAIIEAMTIKSSYPADTVANLLTTRDVDSNVRELAYLKLIGLAEYDFGRPEKGNAALSRWRQWWEWRDADEVSIREKLDSDDLDKCWVAIAIAKQRTLSGSEDLPQISPGHRNGDIEGSLQEWINERVKKNKENATKDGISNKQNAKATPLFAARGQTQGRHTDLRYESLPKLGDRDVTLVTCDSQIDNESPLVVLAPIDVRDNLQFKTFQKGEGFQENVYVKSPSSRYQLALFSIGGDHNSVRFKWINPAKTDIDLYAAYLRACVLKINTLNGTEYVALAKPHAIEKPVEFTSGVAEIKLASVEHMRDNAHKRKNISYRLGRGKVHWNNRDYRFGEEPGEKPPYKIVGLGDEKYTLPAFIESKHEDGEKAVQLRIVGGPIPAEPGHRDTLEGFENASLSAILYRVIDTGDNGHSPNDEILVEEVIVGKQ